MLSLMLSLLADPAVFDGDRLPDGRTCYAMSFARDGVAQPLGTAIETIDRVSHEGRPAIRIVSQQILRRGEMQDTHLLDANSLRPISYENVYNGEPRIHVSYVGNRISGFDTEQDGRQVPVNVQFEAPLWDGHLHGPALASLPLTPGATFTVPTWSHNYGLGDVAVEVKGTREIDTPSGPTEAWVVGITLPSGLQADYFVSTADGSRLGYDAGAMSQRLSDCAA